MNSPPLEGIHELPRTGSGPRSLVLLHGFLGGPETFDDVVAALKRKPPVCIPPLYGHNGVRETDTTRDFDEEILRLEQWIERFARPLPAHLAGYSLGARLALGLLVRAPRLFSSATLVSGRCGLDCNEDRKLRWTTDLRWAERLQRQPLSEFLDAWESQPLFETMRHVAPEKQRRLRYQRLRHDPVALSQALLGLSLSRMPSYAECLSQVRVPVTIVVGALDEKFVALGEELLSRLPNGKLMVVAEAGHHLPVERPEALAAAIDEGMDHD
jgi:2-succinyl-6-hydroxy-2,4-cyclohexadiene-1-carboxylate synthase